MHLPKCTPEPKYSRLLIETDTKVNETKKVTQKYMANRTSETGMCSYGCEIDDEQNRVLRHLVWKLTEQQERCRKRGHVPVRNFETTRA